MRGSATSLLRWIPFLKGYSGNFVNRHLVGNAPQRRALRHRFEAAGLQQHRCLRVLYHRAGRVDRARDREILHARGDIHGLAEIVAAVVERDGETRPLMNADLEQQVLALALFIELAHRLAHAQRGADRPIRGRKRCHHRVADRLHHGAGLGGDDLGQDAEMCSDEVICDQVADAFVKLGGALEIGEQEREAGDVEALIEVERIGAIDVVECLVVSRRFAVKNGLRLPRRSWSASPAIHTPGNTRALVRFSSERRNGPGRNSIVPVGARTLLKTSERFWRSRVASPLMSRNCAACVTGSKTITNSAGSCSDRMAFSPGGNSTESRVTSSMIRSKSLGRSIPELQKI